jgi:hypothetical protein
MNSLSLSLSLSLSRHIRVVLKNWIFLGLAIGLLFALSCSLSAQTLHIIHCCMYIFRQTLSKSNQLNMTLVSTQLSNNTQQKKIEINEYPNYDEYFNSLSHTIFLKKKLI